MGSDLSVTTPPPLEGLGREADQGRGAGSARYPNLQQGTAPTPPPSPLPQGEGEKCLPPSPLLAILLGAAPLLWPAAVNGYPLVFSDTGTYLSQAVHHYLGWDRPVFYSLFLLALHLTLTTWPAIVAQALLASHTLHLLRRALLPAVSAWWLLPLTGALAVATALPWLATRLMPDLFTGLLVLALGLLAFASASLSRGERFWLTGFAAFMIAAHQSHLLLALALLPGVLALRWWLGVRTLRSSIGRDAVPLLLAPALACVALTGVNIIAFHRATVAPFSNVFSLARVIYDGPGMRVLQRDCPRMHWRLCPYLDQFPANADDFLWLPDSPLARAGGAKLVSTEANAIMARALVAEPATELRAILGNAVRQFAQFATGDGLGPWPRTVTPWILRDFPRFEADAYLAARQTNGLPLVPAWLGALHGVVALLGVVLCAALLPVALWRRQRLGGFLVLVLLALPANALIAGGLSGPHDRYQSRVMWLPPLLAALAIVTVANRGLGGQAAARGSARRQDPPRSAQSTRRQTVCATRRAAGIGGMHDLTGHCSQHDATGLLPPRAPRALRWILLASNRATPPRHPPASPARGGAPAGAVSGEGRFP